MMMEDENIQNEITLNVNEIGYIARLIDQEMTIFERMRIKKTTLARIAGALVVYIVTMSVFTIFL